MGEDRVCVLKTVSKKESLEQKCCGVVLEKSKYKQKHTGIISYLCMHGKPKYLHPSLLPRDPKKGDRGPGVGDPQ